MKIDLMHTLCLGGCGRQGRAPSVGRYICAPCTSRIMKADRAMKFAEVEKQKREAELHELDVLHRELRKMSITKKGEP